MALDLSLLSDDMERALEGARVLAERRKQSLIQPEHLLYTLFDHESSLFALLERNGVACGALLDALTMKVNGADGGTLEPGAGRWLRRRCASCLKKVWNVSVDAKAQMLSRSMCCWPRSSLVKPI